jgi:hypothetical protein
MRLGPLICMMFAAMPVAVAAGVLPEGDLVDGTSLVLDGTWLARNYAHEVDCRLNVPEAEQRAWALRLSTLFADQELSPQYVVLVDRNPFVQAIAIYWVGSDRTFHFIGASPVSTGKPGSFDHFITPTGIFVHSIDNPDFRAEGTRNENGILGYGRKGMRVYDFGWQQARRGWDSRGEGTMRLQMHATDPEFLDSRLGTVQSKGCIRVPATLNTFIDRHAILDADYEQAMADGRTFSVLSTRRKPTPWPGRYLVIIDSGRTSRPQWSPLPGTRRPCGRRQLIRHAARASQTRPSGAFETIQHTAE